MDVAWRIRLTIIAVVALVIFGDLYTYGNIRGVRSDDHSSVRSTGITAPGGGGGPVKTAASGSATSVAASGAETEASRKFQQNNNEFDIEEPDITDLQAAAFKQKRNTFKDQLTDQIREACLPKMLCEMASKPNYMLSERERDLLNLIRSSSMSLAMNGGPSKWHFAAQMGELLRHTSDDNSGPIGCASLWPNCPISSKKLSKLSYKMQNAF